MSGPSQHSPAVLIPTVTGFATSSLFFSTAYHRAALHHHLLLYPSYNALNQNPGITTAVDDREAVSCTPELCSCQGTALLLSLPLKGPYTSSALQYFKIAKRGPPQNLSPWLHLVPGTPRTRRAIHVKSMLNTCSYTC